jgi:hypothetical protein
MARRALKVCSEPRCPELTDKTRCPKCAGAYERRRGTRQARGYTAQHDTLRARWKPKVETGQVDCHAITCLLPTRRIHLGMAWDLGHTADRTAWTGPEHSVCNRSAGGKASHARTA